jgi:hypothetical protein
MITQVESSQHSGSSGKRFSSSRRAKPTYQVPCLKEEEILKEEILKTLPYVESNADVNILTLAESSTCRL